MRTKNFLQHAEQAQTNPYYLAFLMAKEKHDLSIRNGADGSEYQCWIRKRWTELKQKLKFSTSVLVNTPLSEIRFDKLRIMWLVKYLNNLERLNKQ